MGVALHMLNWDSGRLAVYPQDMDRLAAWMRLDMVALDLTTMVQELIKVRLWDDFAPSSPPLPELPDSNEVRVWDPAYAWQVGDLAIFPVSCEEMASSPRQALMYPRVGEILSLRGNSAVVSIDGLRENRIYGLVPVRVSESQLETWRQTVEQAVARLGTCAEVSCRVAEALWVHGATLVRRMVSALRQDPRFMSLEGMWFLRQLAELPSPEELAAVNRALLFSEDPLSIDELEARCLREPHVRTTPRRFGLALALQERQDLYANVGTDGRPRWVLIEPPQGQYRARMAAYDPDTFQILCEPGEALSSDAVHRLWDLGLLRRVIGPGDYARRDVTAS